MPKAVEHTKEQAAGKREDSFSGRRFFILMSVGISGAAEALISGILMKQTIDRCIALVFISILFSTIFILGMELYRQQKGWFHEKANNYIRIAAAYGTCCVLSVLFLFLPAFAAPVLVLAVIMTITTNSFLGMVSCIFHIMLQNICTQSSDSLLICNLLLLICGCMIVHYLGEKGNQKWAAIVMTVFTVGNVMIFSYLQTGQFEWNVVSYGLCNGIFSSLAGIIIYRCLIQQVNHTKENHLKKIISENFELVQAVRSFSKADYDHARRVSKIAAECADILEADSNVAAASGFYYRLGRMEGKPYVDNGVALAKKHFFPMEVIEILGEYNGEKKLPSTVESAVVHIIDSVVGKFDVLDKTTLSSTWNQDIIVYQTLNENSAAGLYDKAGFSMNMFLKIRDYLIKEAQLY